MIHIYDGNNVMLRALDAAGHERLSLRRRYELSLTGTHIYCWDGAGHNERRKAIYPAYKANRTPMAEDRFAQIHVFRECLQHSSAVQIECRGWEADDVIAAMVHRFVCRGLQVTVYTNDLDYWQLMQYQGVRIDGIKPESVPNCEPHHIPLYKALVGDKSDNISGVTGFGPKSWNHLTPARRKMLMSVIENDNTDLIPHLDLPTRPQNLLFDAANREEARRALSITKFIPVPDDELEKGISQGVLNKPAADQLLRKFFL